MDELTDKGCAVQFVSERITVDKSGTSPVDGLMLGILAAFAEFERRRIKERQAEGIALTIAVMNTKGGVGKTTASVFLAAGLHAAGHSVELWDADPQGSATEWMDDAEQAWRARHDFPLPVPCLTANRATLARRACTAEILIIDTAPGDPALQTAVAARADLVIVPTEASRLDMSRVWATVDALDKAVPAVVLLNRADPRTRLYTEAIQALGRVS